MDKRLALTIGLSILVLFGWSAFVSKTQPVANKQVIAESAVVNKVQTVAPVTPEAAAVVNLPEKAFTYKQENIEIVFNEASASIKKIVFKKYTDSQMVLSKGLLLNDKTLLFNKENQSANSVTFQHVDNEKKITKKFTIDKANYTIDLEIKIKNLTNTPLRLNLPLILGVLDFSSKNPEARFQDLTVGTQEKTIYTSAQKPTQFNSVKFLGLRDRYFCLIAQPDLVAQNSFVTKITPQEFEVSLTPQELVIPPNSQNGQLFKIYLGPQDLKAIGAINSDWTAIIHYGTFNLISHILLQTLEFLHRILRNWGLAVIALSLLIYLLLYPLSIKQMRSMKEMQAIQPLVEKIRLEHKDNPQKMNKEIMDLYRLHKVNPFGGCLPLILQMPIFFALYNALMRSIVLKGARFLWIKDLSQPDSLFTFPMTLPMLGNSFNILPIIMAIGMFFQQKLSSGSATGSSAEQQKIMLIVMPVMFGFIFYSMPAGLVIYWLVNSILMLIFQLKMSKSK